MAKRPGIDDPTVHIPTTVNVSLPRQFENGDFLEWATRFELCSRSNGWTDSVMAMKLPTLLEGEAYIVYQGLPKEVLNSYVQLKEALTSRLHPDKLGHSALQRFEERKLQPGETVECFAYHLRRLLTLAIPSLDAESKEKLLLHRFIQGLPAEHNRTLRLCSDSMTLQEAVDKARLITDVDSESTHSATSSAALVSKVDQLAAAIGRLELQVEQRRDDNRFGAMQARRYQGPRRCFSCRAIGHIARNCPRRRRQSGDGRPPFASLVISNNQLSCVASGWLADNSVDMLIDSGSSVSLLAEAMFHRLHTDVKLLECSAISLSTAATDKLLIDSAVVLPLRLGQLQTQHQFLIVPRLTFPVVLGFDFLHRHAIQLDCAKMLLKGPCLGDVALHTSLSSFFRNSDNSTHYATQHHTVNAAFVDDGCSIVENCVVPDFSNDQIELPDAPIAFRDLIASNRHLFQVKPGRTSAAYHFIPTADTSPVRIPPRRVPVHLREEVERQILIMERNGIIRPSNSPWLFPAVFTKKKTDSYPLPLPDEVQDRIGGATIFSTLDLNSGFWQLPIHPKDCHKTAFSPGPGMGLYEFVRMPFGLTGGPSSFQRLMDSVLRGLPFTMVYLDDVLIFSRDIPEHRSHLAEVFKRLTQNGLTLRGVKCHIAKPQIAYLGHIFSARGMEPDPSKVAAVTSFERPTNIRQVRQFLGLASYYRRYVKDFATLAAPLHRLLEKAATFQWDTGAEQAFQKLKMVLTSPPVLANPCFEKEFDLFTDASDAGLGAVLEQEGRVIAYASRALNRAEKNFSTIEKECLAIIFATKIFRHYLLAKHFTLFTDHSPLQWLSAQKMEGTNNRNADALSRLLPNDPLQHCLAVQVATARVTVEELAASQAADPILSRVIRSLQGSPMCRGAEWKRFPLRRFAQLLPRLSLTSGVLQLRKISELGEEYSVPVIPSSMKDLMMKTCHEAQTAAHLGTERTLARLHNCAYWFGMDRDILQFCNKCQNMPVGKPWERLGMDILELPESSSGNRYVLVIQDYFTKWLTAFPLKNQTANTVAAHARNFESDLLREVCTTFGITKTRTTPYHPQSDGLVERGNRTILQLLRTLGAQHGEWDKLLPMAIFAYNTSKHSSTGFTPYQLIFGRPPFDLNPLVHLPDYHGYDPPSYHDHLLTRIKRTYCMAKRNLDQAAQRQCRAYNRCATSQPVYHCGDPVWLYRRTCAKLEPRWEGNWLVRKVIGPVTVEIQNNDGQRKVVHVNDLRKLNQSRQDEDPPQTATEPAVVDLRPVRQRHAPRRFLDYVMT